ncbi:MAG: hypothetical protein IJ153_07720 [Clostridia bacterium]|nr:hypothetical protein [Clostridia bacterium]
MFKRRKLDSNRQVIFEVGVVLLFAILVCVWLYGSQHGIRRIDVSNCTPSEGQLLYHIEEFDVSNNNLVVSGWCISSGISTTYFDTYVCIKHKTPEEWYILPTAFAQRKDVTAVLGEGIYNYDNSGFVAQFHDLRRIPSGEYEVYLLYNKTDDQWLEDAGISFTIE